MPLLLYYVPWHRRTDDTAPLSSTNNSERTFYSEDETLLPSADDELAMEWSGSTSHHQLYDGEDHEDELLTATAATPLPTDEVRETLHPRYSSSLSRITEQSLTVDDLQSPLPFWWTALLWDEERELQVQSSDAGRLDSAASSLHHQPRISEVRAEASTSPLPPDDRLLLGNRSNRSTESHESEFRHGTPPMQSSTLSLSSPPRSASRSRHPAEAPEAAALLPAPSLNVRLLHEPIHPSSSFAGRAPHSAPAFTPHYITARTLPVLPPHPTSVSLASGSSLHSDALSSSAVSPPFSLSFTAFSTLQQHQPLQHSINSASPPGPPPHVTGTPPPSFSSQSSFRCARPLPFSNTFSTTTTTPHRITDSPVRASNLDPEHQDKGEAWAAPLSCYRVSVTPGHHCERAKRELPRDLFSVKEVEGAPAERHRPSGDCTLLCEEAEEDNTGAERRGLKPESVEPPSLSAAVDQSHQPAQQKTRLPRKSQREKAEAQQRAVPHASSPSHPSFPSHKDDASQSEQRHRLPRNDRREPVPQRSITSRSGGSAPTSLASRLLGNHFFATHVLQASSFSCSRHPHTGPRRTGSAPHASTTQRLRPRPLRRRVSASLPSRSRSAVVNSNPNNRSGESHKSHYHSAFSGNSFSEVLEPMGRTGTRNTRATTTRDPHRRRRFRFPVLSTSVHSSSLLHPDSFLRGGETSSRSTSSSLYSLNEKNTAPVSSDLSLCGGSSCWRDGGPLGHHCFPSSRSSALHHQHPKVACLPTNHSFSSSAISVVL